MGRDVAPVVTAEILLRHGMADDVASAYLARTWPLDEADCQSAVTAAHILLRREQVREVSKGRNGAVDVLLSTWLPGGVGLGGVGRSGMSGARRVQFWRGSAKPTPSTTSTSVATTTSPNRSTTTTSLPSRTTTTIIPLTTTGPTIPVALPAEPGCVTDGSQRQVRPSGFLLACADGNSAVERASWSSWTSSEAIGHGTVRQNDCVPFCATGHFHTQTADLTLYAPRIWRGHLVFTRLARPSPRSAATGEPHHLRAHPHLSGTSTPDRSIAR